MSKIDLQAALKNLGYSVAESLDGEKFEAASPVALPVGSSYPPREEMSVEERAWLAKRKGKLTGSNFGLLMAGYLDAAELDEKLSKVVEIPGDVLSNGRRAGKAYKEWVEEQPPGAVLLKAKEFDEMKARRERAGGFTQTAITYLNRKLAEKLGSSYSFTSSTVEWGKEFEPVALKLYEERIRQAGSDAEVDSTPFHFVEPIGGLLAGHAGTTPDAVLRWAGEIGGTVEVKCRKDPAIHMATLRSGRVPAENYWQCVGHIAFTDSAYCDFVSFDPTMDEHEYSRLVVIRVNRNEDEVQQLRDRIQQGVDWMANEMRKLRSSMIRQRIEDLAFSPDEITAEDQERIAELFTVGGGDE